MIGTAKVVMGQEEKEAVLRVMDSGMLAMGKETLAFEAEFATYLGVKHVIAVSSGTAGLITALKSLGIGDGDIVATSAFSFIATANAILACGATPLFVDIDQETFNLDAEVLSRLMETIPRLKAILPVHIFGLPANMPTIMALAEDYALPVVEDSCQAHGAEICGQKVGTFGQLGVFSMYATKNMGVGEAGAIVTDDDELAFFCRHYINFGRSGRYAHGTFGLNYKTTDIASAIARVQLNRLDESNDRRIQNAGYLSAGISGVETPSAPDGYKHVFHQYTIRIAGHLRDELIKHLTKWDIGSAIIYPRAVYQQSCYRALGLSKAFSPVAEEVCTEVLSLPVHPHLSDEDLQSIVSAMNQLVAT